jgi:hypothetical protein
MLLGLLADAVLVLHLGFILFVVMGGLLVARFPRIAIAHIPAVLWGIYIELSGRICPLTPFENRLRHMAGETGYEGGFIEHYLMPVIYPHGLTRETQFVLAGAVILVNLSVYGWMIYGWHKRSRKRQD